MKVVWFALAGVGALVILFLLTLVVRSYRAQDTVPDIGVDVAGRLTPCPGTPNCVSSQGEDPQHAMEPWKFESSISSSELIEALQEASETIGDVRWLTETKNATYLHGVFRSSVFRFPDDVEFFIDSNNSVIHFRSASRVGHSDLGANRKRMELIREELEKLIGK